MAQPRVAVAEASVVSSTNMGTRVLLVKLMTRPMEEAKLSRIFFSRSATPGSARRMISVSSAYWRMSSGSPSTSGCWSTPSCFTNC
jgi:hypothetical protein